MKRSESSSARMEARSSSGMCRCEGQRGAAADGCTASMRRYAVDQLTPIAAQARLINKQALPRRSDQIWRMRFVTMVDLSATGFMACRCGSDGLGGSAAKSGRAARQGARHHPEDSPRCEPLVGAVYWTSGTAFHRRSLETRGIHPREVQTRSGGRWRCYDRPAGAEL
jgi:hypothetical protein